MQQHTIPSRKRLKEIEKQADRVASLATFNNPVSIMQLGRVSAAARAALLLGVPEEAAVERCRALIVKINAGEA